MLARYESTALRWPSIFFSCVGGESRPPKKIYYYSHQDHTTQPLHTSGKNNLRLRCALGSFSFSLLQTVVFPWDPSPHTWLAPFGPPFGQPIPTRTAVSCLFAPRPSWAFHPASRHRPPKATLLPFSLASTVTRHSTASTALVLLLSAFAASSRVCLDTGVA